MIIGKLGTKIVQIESIKHSVAFSQETGWVLVNPEPGKRCSAGVRWIPASSQFEWIRNFTFGESK